MNATVFVNVLVTSVSSVSYCRRPHISVCLMFMFHLVVVVTFFV